MRYQLLATIALGLAAAGCSNEAGSELENEGNTMEAPAASEQDQLAMGDPQAAVANQNANRVFFALDSAELRAPAREQLDRVIAAYQQTPEAGFTVAGFTDTTGTRPYNEQLSRQRAQAVRTYLTQNGIAADQIEIEAQGQSNLNVETQDGVREPANRRVRIEFGDE